jgi:hypothetical protein
VICEAMEAAKPRESSFQKVIRWCGEKRMVPSRAS